MDDRDLLDRAQGVLVGMAAGDALGAPYEFGPPLADDAAVGMTGGGSFGWAGGEWTDDTSMAICIARVAADGADLRTASAQDRIVAAWVEWARTAKDVGIQTGAVLGGVGTGGSAAARRAAATLHSHTGRSGGNGSLMRTAPVALACLDDADALVDAATQLSALTHFDPEAGEACVLWCLAIRHGVRTGSLDLRLGLDAFAADRRAVWADRLDVAESSRPADFENNGWVVEALQGAWSAISGAVGLREGVEAAVRGGRDADTVAAIAGGLLGAVHGASAVPAEWRDVLHGWPGMRADELVHMASAIASG